MGRLYLRCKLECDILEILLRNSQCVACVGEEYIAAMLVYGHVGVLAALEVGELLGILRLNPAGLVDGDGFPATLRAILMLQAVLDNLKLKCTHRADNLAAVERRGEELRHTLIHKLVDALCELLELHGVGILDVAEVLGRE